MAFFDNLKNKLNEKAKETLASGFFNTQERSSTTPPPINKPSAGQTPPSIPVPPTSKPKAAAEQSLYSDKIEKLIDFALADGVLTEKEKQVLFNKARQEGIDLDEFEMVLESKLYEKQQEQLKELSASMAPPAPMAPAAPPAAPSASSASSAAPKSNKYGEIRKCPCCGHVVQAFEAICPDCGHEFSGIGANSSMEKLVGMIDEIKKRKIKYNFWSDLDPDEQRLRDITECIMNFPVPNTKSDLYEFIISCATNIRKGNYDDDTKTMNKAWNAKARECYDKVRLLMKSDPATIQEIEDYLIEKGLLVEEKKGLFKRESTGKYVWKD